MGVLPIELIDLNFKINGNEKVRFNITNLEIRKNIDIYFNDKLTKGILRIDSEIEKEYYESGGILNYVLKQNYFIISFMNFFIKSIEIM